MRVFPALRTLSAALLLVLPACGGGGSSGSTGPAANAVFSGDPAADGSVSLGGLMSSPSGGVPVGDFFNNDAGRGFLRFAHPSIPTGATVLSATLHAQQVSVTGTPFADLGPNVVVDHVDIDLGAGPGLDAQDYNSAAFSLAIGSLSSGVALGSKWVDVTAAVQADVTAGRTKSDFRLTFALATDGNADIDQVMFTDAEASGPALLVTWK
jgi:hypothetical protein